MKITEEEEKDECNEHRYIMNAGGASLSEVSEVTLKSVQLLWP